MRKPGQAKLIHWLASMASLLLISIVLAGHYWFVVLPDRIEYIGREVWEYLPPLGSHLMTFAVGFVPVAVWHLGDLIQNRRLDRPLLVFLDRYELLYGSLIVWGMVALLGQAEFLNDLGCPATEQGPTNLTFDGCGSFAPDWKLALFLSVSLIICVICLAKLFIAIATQFRNAK